MSRHPLGWSYPAGAENDPNAPWNQRELPDCCPVCGEPNTNEDGSDIHDGIYCSAYCEVQGEDDGAP